MSLTKDMAFLDSTQLTEIKMNSLANRHFAADNRNAMSNRGIINSQPE